MVENINKITRIDYIEYICFAGLNDKQHFRTFNGKKGLGNPRFTKIFDEHPDFPSLLRCKTHPKAKMRKFVRKEVRKSNTTIVIMLEYNFKESIV